MKPKVGDWVRFYQTINGTPTLVLGVVEYVAGDGKPLFEGAEARLEVATSAGSTEVKYILEVRRPPIQGMVTFGDGSDGS